MTEINRSELRKIIMTILYQISVYDSNKIKYDVKDVIKESLKVENEFVEAHTVPEFINIHSRRDDTPDIKFRIINDDGTITNT